MKFIIKNAGENQITFMRKIGYFFIDKNQSYIRPLERNGYPRFHIYLEIDSQDNKIIFNLHLDQKKPIYKGVSAHSGEYDGIAVETEAQRIKQILEPHKF